MKQTTVPIVTIDELRDWQTKRLLGRLKSLRQLEEALGSSDATASEVFERRTQGIAFKSDDTWRSAYEDVKELLASREHVK